MSDLAPLAEAVAVDPLIDHPADFHVFHKFLERCKTLPAISTAVVWPLSDVALKGAVEAAIEGLIEPTLIGDEAEMKALAEKIRAEAAAGGNFEKLQAKAYKLAGETDDPPDPDLGDKWTRDTFPPEQLSAVLALKPGEVSQPLHNESGWHILKMVSRRTMPWSEAHDFTRQMIVADQANGIRKAIKAEYNDQYFVSAASREAAGSAK